MKYNPVILIFLGLSLPVVEARLYRGQNVRTDKGISSLLQVTNEKERLLDHGGQVGENTNIRGSKTYTKTTSTSSIDIDGLGGSKTTTRTSTKTTSSSSIDIDGFQGAPLSGCAELSTAISTKKSTSKSTSKSSKYADVDAYADEALFEVSDCFDGQVGAPEVPIDTTETSEVPQILILAPEFAPEQPEDETPRQNTTYTNDYGVNCTNPFTDECDKPDTR